MPPWKYLGSIIDQTTVRPQKIELNPTIKILNDVQKIVGDINWVWTICRITNSDLQALLHVLSGGGGVNAPQNLTEAAQKALENIGQKIVQGYTSHWIQI